MRPWGSGTPRSGARSGGRREDTRGARAAIVRLVDINGQVRGDTLDMSLKLHNHP